MPDRLADDAITGVFSRSKYEFRQISA